MGDRETVVLIAVAAAAVAAMLVAAAILLVKVVKARRLLRDAGVPWTGKAAFVASVVYLFWPVDLLPDPILLDDIGFLLLALRSLHQAARRAGLLDDGTELSIPPSKRL